jgi:hypothetical protein
MSFETLITGIARGWFSLEILYHKWTDIWTPGASKRSPCNISIYLLPLHASEIFQLYIGKSSQIRFIIKLGVFTVS